MVQNTTSSHNRKSDFQQEVLLKLKQLRVAKGWSQPKIAEILDVTNGRIGNIESTNQPHKYTLSQVNRLCKEFGVSISELFTGDSNCTSEALVDAIVMYEEGK